MNSGRVKCRKIGFEGRKKGIARWRKLVVRFELSMCVVVALAVLYELVTEENSQEMAPQKRMKVEAPAAVVASTDPPAIYIS